jgi:hypothetical protein
VLVEDLATSPVFADSPSRQVLLARHAGDALERWRADESLRRSRDNLERQFADRTRWLTLLHEISESITDAPTWDSALQRLLERVCAMEEWQIGYVYLPDPEAPSVIAPGFPPSSHDPSPSHQPLFGGQKNASSTGGKRVGSFSARNLSACLSCPRCAPWRFPQASLSPSQALTNQEAGLTCSFVLLFVSTVQ